ncbi:hypothetical protein BDB01DRAFT_805363 [Pilobolus umbonatus]|nr:hypothetical protein BDB01DRAFT_805363 [Pilobolus umbonatus]
MSSAAVHTLYFTEWVLASTCEAIRHIGILHWQNNLPLLFVLLHIEPEVILVHIFILLNKYRAYPSQAEYACFRLPEYRI